MNKKLIALAVAGACAVPTVMAQSANPITLYGALRMDLEWVEAKGTNGADDRVRLTDHPSLIGVRGTEDLGGGLKAFFQLETAFDSDDSSGGATGFANRNSGVGLQGGWGSVLIGRWDTPMKQAIVATDLWGDVNKADYTAATMDQGNFSRRNANVIQYWSPNWSGFQLKAMYQVDEAKTATAEPIDTGVSLTYSKGALYLAAAWEKHDDQAGSTVTAGVDEEGLVFGARYDFGNFRLSGHYGQYEKANGDDDKSYYIGGQYTMGKHEFLVTWQNSEQGAAECDVIGAGWRYRFSKRTHWQLSYVDIDNNATGNCNFGAGGSLGGNGSNPTGFGLGVFHFF
jgi:predicted porin